MNRPGLVALAAAAVVAAACGGTTPPASGSGQAAASRVVTDMRGVEVRVPAAITRVATINDGLVESVMTRLGVVRSLVALGSDAQRKTWSYSYPSASGASWTIADGMGTMRALHPWLADLPMAAGGTGDAVNIETLAAARPDVVIVRTGDCTVGVDSDAAGRLTALLDAMGIPVVVLRSTAVYRNQGPATLRDEILLLGRLFGREDEAASLADDLAAAGQVITSRVAAGRGAVPMAAYLGLASGARDAGGAAYVWGTDTTESWMLERLAGGRNAYRGAGARVLLNAEQILALDPDVIFLPTSAGYHPRRELAEAPYFAELRRLKAVRAGRVYPLPWTPLNCARRLEYPIDLMVMAKGLHPDRFADLRVHEWVLDFYKTVYGVNDEQARLLRRAQWLDWMVDAGF
jgi:iron complex transport system substrate-binding protein